MADKIKEYFDTNAIDPLVVGVYPMGTGLDIERPYRHYWELKKFISYLPKKDNLTLIELGCGAGRWGVSLARTLKKYIGIDISHSQIEIAKNIVNQRKLTNVIFMAGDLSQLALLNEEINIVYASGVFQYVEDTEVENILKQTKQLLANDGIFIDRSTFIAEKERLVRDDTNYFCIYRRKKELIEIFEKNGFELIGNSRSYVYLRNKTFFNHKKISTLIKWGILHMETITFYIMRALSLIFERIDNTEHIHESIGIFSHEFTVFRLKNE